MQQADQWYYYTQAGQQVGPMDFDGLQAAARAGHFQPDDYVWHEGYTDWTPAHQVPGLFNVGAGPAGPQPPQPAAADQPAPAVPLGDPQPAGAGDATVHQPMAEQAIYPPWFHGYAGFWRRVLAYILDTILLAVVAGLLVAPLVALLADTHADAEAAGNAVMFVLGWLYFALMESSSAQATLGKQAIGIHVTDLYGRRISFARATGRHFGKILSSLILGIGFLMVAFTERRQGLHDILAGCLVVKTR